MEDFAFVYESSQISLDYFYVQLSVIHRWHIREYFGGLRNGPRHSQVGGCLPPFNLHVHGRSGEAWLWMDNRQEVSQDQRDDVDTSASWSNIRVPNSILLLLLRHGFTSHAKWMVLRRLYDPHPGHADGPCRGRQLQHVLRDGIFPNGTADIHEAHADW